MTIRYPFSGRFIHRETLLNDLRERVESGISQVRIVGGVGSGKTSLALQSLIQPYIHNRFPRGPVFYSLADPNFTAVAALKTMDARLRKSRVNFYSQTAYSKGEEGYSPQSSGDSKVATIRFGLAQVNLDMPRDGCIVVLDDVSPLETANGIDSTRDLLAVFLNNIYPPDKNLYLSLMRPWDSERIPYAEYGRVQDCISIGGYTSEEVFIAWKWNNDAVCQAFYYNPLALSFYRALEDRKLITEDALFSITPDDVQLWVNSLFLPWTIACGDSYWSLDFWMPLVTLLALPESGTESELMNPAAEKWAQVVRRFPDEMKSRERTSAAIRNDMVDLEMAGLIHRKCDPESGIASYYVSRLAKTFAVYWLRAHYRDFYAIVSSDAERIAKTWSLNIFTKRR